MKGLTDVINAGRNVTEARVYNGFTWPERAATNRPANAERKRPGMNPVVCSITGFTDPANLSGRGYMFSHNEDYARPLWWHPVSRRTHARLHARFRDPRPWFDIVAAHYEHGAWFTFLSMNPLLQWPTPGRKPFWSIYPEGLPDVGDQWTDLADQIGLSADLFRSADLRDPIRALWRIPKLIVPARPEIAPRARVRR